LPAGDSVIALVAPPPVDRQIGGGIVFGGLNVATIMQSAQTEQQFASYITMSAPCADM
jgi:hypothetical protein